ncbi:MAG: tetratricopeptide repeat protein [Treponemataceae bacterium]|nr:tetratricopeptide repeat protein [Treponemataceae bacterium]
MNIPFWSTPGRCRSFFLVFFALFVIQGTHLVSQNSDALTLEIRRLFQAGDMEMIRENWYGAVEYFLEVLQKNPNHGDSMARLAECYYQLREFDQALAWVRRARVLDRGNLSLANLEALCLIALGKLDDASLLITQVLQREPYNREALFTSAELELARGRPGEALKKYQETARRFPDDKRALLSLSLVLGSLGDSETARLYIQRALNLYGDDYRVFYYGAYLDSQAGALEEAAKKLERALILQPSFVPARSLLGIVQYRRGRYEEAARLADQIIGSQRNEVSAWYLKGLSYARLGRSTEARNILQQAVKIDGENEILRIALENLVIQTTAVESPERTSLARWHFDRARQFQSRHLSEEALFEYRRGLRINPYGVERKELAELWRIQGYPQRYVDELRFLQEIGRADRVVQDAVEAYDSLLADTLSRRRGVDTLSIATNRYWNVAVFSVATQSSVLHVDAGRVVAEYVQDLFTHEGNVQALSLPIEQTSFSGAFRTAREGGADYFIILGVTENSRDVRIQADLYVARTGSRAVSFSAYKVGNDRLRNAARSIMEQLRRSLPFRARLIQRVAGEGLIDRGKAEGVQVGTSYRIIKKNALMVQSEGIGLVYSPSDVVGTIKITEVDDYCALGTLARQGFFDRISVGDEVLFVEEGPSPSGASQTTAPIDPELRDLLQRLR